jgi:hypothetical protein
VLRVCNKRWQAGNTSRHVTPTTTAPLLFLSCFLKLPHGHHKPTAK